MIKVGLLGYGRAGSAVARVLEEDPRVDLRWIARRSAPYGSRAEVRDRQLPMVGMQEVSFETWLHKHPVDALIDFSSRESLQAYAPCIKDMGLTLVSAISSYEQPDLELLKALGRHARVLASPNMTLGVNFLTLAAKWLRKIAPFADVEIVEQHFKHKPEVSGTASRIAETLELNPDRITSLRLGGIVGHHEVIFGFPYQTVRLIHESIGREAFGTGALYALLELSKRAPGFYTFDNILDDHIRQAFSTTGSHP